MPPKAKDNKDVKVIAELTVTSPEGTETVRTFSKAWQRGLELPRPVRVQFSGFARLD